MLLAFTECLRVHDDLMLRINHRQPVIALDDALEESIWRSRCR